MNTKTLLISAALAVAALSANAQTIASPSTSEKAQGFQGAQPGDVDPAGVGYRKNPKTTPKKYVPSPSASDKAQGFQGAQPGDADPSAAGYGVGLASSMDGYVASSSTSGKAQGFQGAQK